MSNVEDPAARVARPALNPQRACIPELNVYDVHAHPGAKQGLNMCRGGSEGAATPPDLGIDRPKHAMATPVGQASTGRPNGIASKQARLAINTKEDNTIAQA